MKPDKHIERRIVIGLIVSDTYIKEVSRIWDARILQSQMAQTIASWAMEYFEKYEKAPGKDIEGIYLQKLKAGLNRDVAEDIEEDILPDLSDEYDRSHFNVQYLMDQTKAYFRERNLSLFADQITGMVSQGDLTEAETLASEYKPLAEGTKNDLDLSSQEADTHIATAFSLAESPIVTYPGALGRFLNHQLVRGGYVAFLGSEKRGKCLPSSQKILMSTGEELSLGEVVEKNRKDIISFDETNQKFIKSEISEFWKNGVKPVFQVTTRTGRKVEITGNHPFLTPDGWKELSEIEIGSFIAVPKTIHLFGSGFLSEEKIRLLAYFIAEGCLVTNGVRFTTADEDIKKDFTRCIHSMDCAISWYGIDAEIRNSEENRGKHNKNYVREMLRKHGLMGGKSYDKKIPDIIFQLPKKDMALFLRVLFTCDGWVNESKKGTDYQIGFAVANEILARQVQSLFIRFGIVSKITFQKNDKKGAWTVSISDWENMMRFARDIGFLFNKQRKLNMVLSNRKVSYRSFLDKFPYQIAKKFHDDVLFELEGITTIISQGKGRCRHQKIPTFRRIFKKANGIRGQVAIKAPVMRQSFLEVRGTKTGQKYFNSQILWDQVLDIQYIGKKETYDLTVPNTHNFVAENILVHNTWTLMDLSIRACQQGANVAFFQAGDMTEDQQLRRICISLAGRSDKPKYCKSIRLPVLDCGRNFNDECDRDERKGRGCINPKVEANQAYSLIKDTVGKSQEALDELLDGPGKDYKPCGLDKCPDFVGSVWFQMTKPVKPLTAEEAQVVRREFFKPKGKVIKRKRGKFKLSTYYNGTLSIKEIRAVLDRWEQQDNFVPDVVLIDYMDLLIDPTNEFRHKQNEIWKGGRRISQERHCLVVTVTQADADSYDRDTLSLKNFSEDKRKYSHVTAFYGLNQDRKGTEKKLGVMRINELMVRDDEGGSGRQVCVLQALQQGKPFVSSFFDQTPRKKKI